MYTGYMDALLMEKAMEMIIGFDESDVIVYANPAAKEELGYGENIIGMKLRHIVKLSVEKNRISFQPDIHKEELLLCAKGGEAFAAKTRLLEAHGEEMLSFLLALKIMC